VSSVAHIKVNLCQKTELFMQQLWLSWKIHLPFWQNGPYKTSFSHENCGYLNVIILSEAYNICKHNRGFVQACVNHTLFNQIYLFIHPTLWSDHSLESSWIDDSTKWPLYRVWWRYKDFSIVNTHVVRLHDYSPFWSWFIWSC